MFLVVNCVSIGYTFVMEKKDAGLRIRIERDLREEFVEACQNDGKSAAQVLREFIRDYVGANALKSQKKNNKKRQPNV